MNTSPSRRDVAGTARRAMLVEMFSEIVLAIGGMLLIPFGSYVTETDIMASDVDMAVIFTDHVGAMTNPQRTERLDELCLHLENQFTHMVTNRAGRFPTIRINQRIQGASTTGDIVIHDAHGVVSTWVLMSIINATSNSVRMHIVLPLIRRVKEWMRNNRLSGASKGNHPSIVFTYLVVSFLQYKRHLGRAEFRRGSPLGQASLDEGILIEMVKRGCDACLAEWTIVHHRASTRTALYPKDTPPDVLFRECLEYILFVIEGIFPAPINTTAVSTFVPRKGGGNQGMAVLDPLDGRNIVTKKLEAEGEMRLANALNMEIDALYMLAKGL